MTTKTKGTETLEYKQSLLNGVLAGIEIQMARPSNPLIKAKIDALQNGLNTRLRALVEKVKHEEIDLKLAVFREVSDVLKAS